MTCVESFYNTTSGGTINSPGWPENYQNMIYCAWIIEVNTGSSIKLTFESFGVEYEDKCEFDFLSIRYVNILFILLGFFKKKYKKNIVRVGEEESEMVKLCGGQLPSPVEIDSNKAKIIFSSDGATTDSGFKINWETFLSQNSGGMD